MYNLCLICFQKSDVGVAVTSPPVLPLPPTPKMEEKKMKRSLSDIPLLLSSPLPPPTPSVKQTAMQTKLKNLDYNKFTAVRVHAIPGK